MIFTMIYHFCLKKMKIEKAEKLVVNLHDENEYVMHMKNLKQTLKSRISAEKSS